MRFALIARRATPTNEALAAAGGPEALWEEMTPEHALDTLAAGDVALGRLDVLPTLDGMDEGLWVLSTLAARGVVVLNGPSALLGMHDKLLTARLLARAGVPHPRTLHARDGRPMPVPTLPVVLKPRYGSWGREVRRCDDYPTLEAALDEIRHSTWFQRHGAVVQELVPPRGYDLRIVVADGHVVGAVYRVAASGEWRTNVALGGVRRTVEHPPADARTLAVAAAAAAGASFAGVDLVPSPRGWIVLEVNGAVELTRDYAPWGDVFAEIAAALVRGAGRRRSQDLPLAADTA